MQNSIFTLHLFVRVYFFNAKVFFLSYSTLDEEDDDNDYYHYCYYYYRRAKIGEEKRASAHKTNATECNTVYGNSKLQPEIQSLTLGPEQKNEDDNCLTSSLGFSIPVRFSFT